MGNNKLNTFSGEKIPGQSPNSGFKCGERIQFSELYTVSSIYQSAESLYVFHTCKYFYTFMTKWSFLLSVVFSLTSEFLSMVCILKTVTMSFLKSALSQRQSSRIFFCLLLALTKFLFSKLERSLSQTKEKLSLKSSRCRL